jgi:hypothetical protein
MAARMPVRASQSEKSPAISRLIARKTWTWSLLSRYAQFWVTEIEPGLAPARQPKKVPSSPADYGLERPQPKITAKQ